MHLSVTKTLMYRQTPWKLKEMWNKSVQQNRMRYTTFVGNGDSKAYKTVCDEKPYGEVDIIKADCIGHVQKRISSSIRVEKESDRTGGWEVSRGQSRLTADVMEKRTMEWQYVIICQMFLQCQLPLKPFFTILSSHIRQLKGYHIRNKTK